MIEYRKIFLEDVNCFSKLRTKLFKELYKEKTDDDLNNLTEANIKYISESIKNGNFIGFIATDNERMIATSGLSFYTTPPTFSNKNGINAYIMSVYTEPEYRGNGIVSRLLNMMIEEVKNKACKKITLYASENGYPIYKKYGFIQCDNFMEYQII